VTEKAKSDERCRVPAVTRKTLIVEVLQTRPLAGKVLREAFGLPCDECVVAETETIEEGALYYGHDADAIVAKLNELATGSSGAQSGSRQSAHEMNPKEPPPPKSTGI